MSMVVFTDPGRMPVLVADSLISGPDDESALTTPDHPHGVSGVFPPKSGFVPTYLARKTCLIGSNLALAMVGGVIHMRAFREDLQAHFRDRADASAPDLNSFLNEYAVDKHGKIVLANLDALLMCTRRVDEDRHLYFVRSAGANPASVITQESKNLGGVLAIGCGAEPLKVAIDAIDSYAFSGIGKSEDWNASHEAIAKNLALIAQLHKVDELTGRMLIGYWGGGYEVIYRQVGDGLAYLNDYTILFWTLDLEDEGSECWPEGFIKYKRRDDCSILVSYRQGEFTLKGMVDVGMRRRPLTIERPDREYLNSSIHMNVVCLVASRRLISMFHFCHLYKRGKSNPSMVFMRDDGRAEIYMPETWKREMSQFIRESERKRRKKRSGE
ncbi:MAG: hypothetical protein F4Z95_05000 [Gammaproteobacteria bacterium]|nr:hypothetical protein [Gammaproteobacteria bacterium]